MAEREIIGFYHDKKIEKKRPITVRKGVKHEKTKSSLTLKHSLTEIVKDIAEYIPANLKLSFLTSVIDELNKRGRIDEAKNLLRIIEEDEEIREQYKKKLEIKSRKSSRKKEQKKKKPIMKKITRTKEIKEKILRSLESGKVDDAISLIRKLSGGDRIDILRDTAFELGKLGKHKDVMELLKTSCVEPYEADSILKSLVEGLLSVERMEEAIEVAREISFDYRPYAFSVIIYKLIEIGKVDEALKHVDEIIDVDKLRIRCFSDMLSRSISDTNMVLKILKTFEEKHPAKRRISLREDEVKLIIESEKEQLFNEGLTKSTVIRALSDRRLDELLNMLKMLNIKPPYDDLALTLAGEHRPYEALKIIDKVSYSYKPYVLSYIYEDLIRKGDYNKALELLKNKHHTINIKKETVYADIAKKLIREGRINKILEIVNDTQVGRRIKKEILHILARELVATNVIV
ncbi:MAG: hypothetical protein B6U95_07520 [Thermofilum sp. ex4484_82]|nr:MAG: hypothetical protein B6U95_07520 [Thermofilum sp. ex4484_82]OYT37071.1 MAG: hypothetical protein B6U96_07515 [Archaeoglobales archaeon ex4484_92]